MKNILSKVGFIILIIPILLILSLSQAEVKGPKTHKVNCDKKKQTIQKKVDKANPGDVIEVSGDCRENIIIENNRITLRAVAGATLTAANPDGTTIRVRGLNTRILDFASISEGRNVIIVERGASALIQSNTIEDGRRGIRVHQGAYASIVGNIIQNNDVSGGRDGIAVVQLASADIVSNTITRNGGNGILVGDGSAADIDDNTITDNVSNGILVRFTSHIRLSSEPGLGKANLIQGNNRGIVCQTNSSIRSGKAQNFGTGNFPGNTLIQTTCVVSGTLL